MALRRSMRIWQVIAITTVLTNLSVFSADTATSFREIHSLIKPNTPEESWVQIPWMTSLWEARERAAATGKPILLWEMDGHPLGCT